MTTALLIDWDQKDVFVTEEQVCASNPKPNIITWTVNSILISCSQQSSLIADRHQTPVASISQFITSFL